MTSTKDVKESMIQQLRAQGRDTAHNLDMIDRYMELRRLAAKLKKDIQDNGLRIITTNGNGFEVEKDNASVRNLSATVQAMLSLRQKMKLDDPVPVQESDDDYL